MKYNKEWKRYMAMSAVDPSCALSYDRWKKRIKQPSVHFTLNWRLLLSRECQAVDERIFGGISVLGVCFSRRRLLDEDKVNVCDLNKRTLYKICKKIDRQLLKDTGKRVAMEWYIAAVRDKAFKFLGCPELVLIRLRQKPVECPICFESVDAATAIVTRCCHVFCQDCATRVWGLDKYALYSKDLQMRMKRAAVYGPACPVCRHNV